MPPVARDVMGHLLPDSEALEPEFLDIGLRLLLLVHAADGFDPRRRVLEGYSRSDKGCLCVVDKTEGECLSERGVGLRGTRVALGWCFCREQLGRVAIEFLQKQMVCSYCR